MIDDGLRERLRAVDGEVPLGPAASQRVVERMLDAYGDAANMGDPSPQSNEPVDLGVVPIVGVRSRTRPRWTAWTARAAVVAVIAGGAVGIALLANDDRRPTSPGVTSPQATPPFTAPTTPTTMPERIDVLGYVPFTTYRYVNVREIDGGSEFTSMTDRIGEFVPGAAAGEVGVPLRRSMIEPESGEERRSTVELVSRSDGLLAPVEWLDPAAIGGACAGGSVLLTSDGATVVDPAVSCNDGSRTLAIISSIGPAEQLDLGTGTSVRATPMTIDLRFDSTPETRRVTLWFSDGGLARWSFGQPGAALDFDLDEP